MLKQSAYLQRVVVPVDLVPVLPALAVLVIRLVRGPILMAVFVARQVRPHDELSRAPVALS